LKAVLDASALLAFLQGEPGSEDVEAALPDACISAVNWSEVVQKALAALEALLLHATSDRAGLAAIDDYNVEYTICTQLSGLIKPAPHTPSRSAIGFAAQRISASIRKCRVMVLLHFQIDVN